MSKVGFRTLTSIQITRLLKSLGRLPWEAKQPTSWLNLQPSWSQEEGPLGTCLGRVWAFGLQ